MTIAQLQIRVAVLTEGFSKMDKKIQKYSNVSPCQKKKIKNIVKHHKTRPVTPPGFDLRSPVQKTST